MKRTVISLLLVLLLTLGAAAAQSGYLDGAYEGSAQGRNGPIFVEVWVHEGAVSDIRIAGHSETPTRFELARQILPQMIGARSDAEIEAVDAVSGATLSCRGIKNAVLNALRTAQTAPSWGHAADGSCPGNTFADLPPYGSWAHEPIDWAVTTGLTQGVSATRFAPEAACTRAQIVTFLWRAAGCPESEPSGRFSDVQPDAWYAAAVFWAADAGVTQGTSETVFSPEAPCTRAQALTFLYRAEGSPRTDDQTQFSDVPQDAWYYRAVCWALERGVTAGTSETTFSPLELCTRAQIVTLLFRAR